MNPCKLCIVSPMCRKLCDLFVKYVENELKTYSFTYIDRTMFIADQLRHGNVKITTEGLLWKRGGLIKWRVRYPVSNI